MLKKLSPMHREAMRRLVVGEPTQDVADELGVHPGTVSGWLSDPKFLSELHALEERANKHLTENQETALAIIQNSQSAAANNCREAVADGTVGGEDISPETRLKASWDLLDRGGHKAIEKKEVGIYDLADLIRLAEERATRQPVEAEYEEITE